MMGTYSHFSALKSLTLAFTAILFMLATEGGAQAAPLLLNSADYGDQPDLIEVANRVLPSVITISCTRLTKDPFGRDVIQAAAGTGFYIDNQGTAATNWHVVNNCKKILVEDSEGKKFPVTVQRFYPHYDIAIIQIVPKSLPATGSPAVEISPQDPRFAETTFTIGNPMNMGHSLSVGRITSRKRNLAMHRFNDIYQTDTAMNMGNSGGPFFNEEGKVIGMGQSILSNDGTNTGIGYIIPGRMIKSAYENTLKNTDEVAFLGLLPMESPSPNSDILDASQYDVMIAGVIPQSLAQRLGLKQGDQLLTWQGQTINSIKDFAQRISASTPGERVELAIARMTLVEYQPSLEEIESINNARLAKGQPPVDRFQKMALLTQTLLIDLSPIPQEGHDQIQASF